jgi:TPR repeat protein
MRFIIVIHCWVCLLICFCCSNTYSSNQYITDYAFAHIEKNKNNVIQYLKRNADTNAEAAYILGLLYKDDSLIDLSFYYIWKAAQSKHVKAINALGDIYYSDKKDMKNAIRHYRVAASMGYGPSQFNLGIIYLKHKKKYKLAKYWLLKASQNKKTLCEKMRASALNYAKPLLYD